MITSKIKVNPIRAQAIPAKVLLLMTLAEVNVFTAQGMQKPTPGSQKEPRSCFDFPITLTVS